MSTAFEPINGVSYYPAVVDDSLCERVKTALMDANAHSGADILIEGVRHPAPRLVSSFSDTVLGLEGMESSRTWTPELAELRDLVASVFSLNFNYALANLYRNGDDYTGWHSDKAALHLDGSKIAIVSFGAPRRLSIRSYEYPKDAQTFTMEEGSVVVMDLGVQATHEHSVPKEENPTDPRMSITLRKLHILDEYLRQSE
ncbi:alpha-ketoglutarate-dependent dioxygenase AlkB [Kocuria atrinae]|uniref:alpha-ketoglutarate-dependent dioxygenase AlkB n=1 Tax=Kocuria atrinae TaxID=592377 RepID=UPI0031DCFF9F